MSCLHEGSSQALCKRPALHEGLRKGKTLSEPLQEGQGRFVEGSYLPESGCVCTYV